MKLTTIGAWDETARLAAAEWLRYGGEMQEARADELSAASQSRWRGLEVCLAIEESAGEQDFEWTIDGDQATITAADSGRLLHGVYTFIERYMGVHFTILGDRQGKLIELPASERYFGKPGVAIRGTLPWHNFLSGPSGWNEEDYFVYIERLAKLRCNFVMFHVYTGGL